MQRIIHPGPGFVNHFCIFIQIVFFIFNKSANKNHPVSSGFVDIVQSFEDKRLSSTYLPGKDRLKTPIAKVLPSLQVGWIACA